MLVLLALAGCGGAKPVVVKETGQSAARWDALSARFLEAAFARDPNFASQQGRHEHDGEIVDLSRVAVEAWDRELHTLRDEVKAARELDDTRAFEREYLLAVIDGYLFSDERARDHIKSPLAHANAIDPTIYLTREYAPLDRRMQAYVRHLRAIPAAIDTMLATLEAPLPRTFVDVGLQVFGGLVPYLRDDAPPLFASVQDAMLQAELRSATAAAVPAVERALAWLQKAPTNDAFAMGPELFREMLWAEERVDTPLEQLRAIAEADLARNRAALERACGELFPGGTLEACAESIKGDKPVEGPVAAAREQVRMLRQFVLAQDLVSIPSQQEARVEEAPPHKRWNQAYIEIPGPYEASLPSTYYIAPPDPKWSAEERRGYLPGRMDLLFITVHEVWPGHFLQFLHANTSPRPLGRVYVGYAFAEGWAHYAEELAWESGLGPQDGRMHVGQLLNALLRDVRFMSAIGLHTEGMTVEQSVKMFETQAYQDHGNALQQARRGTV
ncbi:MAG TPA: DUF885 domain-containing protein, partial [Polyangiales bacterium]|nr:DUF885 domain-containing protein [Polyangiales bacterium]